MTNAPEVWQRGPLPGVHPLLMPAAHALLQTVEDVERAVEGLTPEQYWRSPGGAAAVGFHVRHLSGSIDRLLTYARGERLSPAQREALAAESGATEEPAVALARLRETVDRALAQIRSTTPESLTDGRAVGRAGLPSTVIGLTFHAAEHSQRHAGQIVTTAKIVRGMED